MAITEKGIDGTVSGGMTGRIDEWAVQGQQVVNDQSAFGDGGESRFCPGKRVFQVSCTGHVTGTASSIDLKLMGTASVTLYNGTNIKHAGVVVYSNAREQQNYKTGNTDFAYSGVFDGDPN